MAVRKFVVKNRAYLPVVPDGLPQIVQAGAVVEFETDPAKGGMKPGEGLELYVEPKGKAEAKAEA